MSKLVSQTAIWRSLEKHWQRISTQHMRQVFEQEFDRFHRMSLSAAGLMLDYSKNRIDGYGLDLLMKLAESAHLPEWISRMFSGDRINVTEHRSVLHTALRNRGGRPVRVDGEDLMPAVTAVLERMETFTDAVRNGDWRGFSGKQITDVVNIGIGGSDLGPMMAVESLSPYAHDRVKVHFVSNVDDAHIGWHMAHLAPETTLFIVSSKSFTTIDTIDNALTARAWLLEYFRDEAAVARHFVAVSTNHEAVEAFGIDVRNMFEFWEWVGGRYSMWSAIGLPIAMSIGMRNFYAMLDGAHAMDEHFRTASLQENLPVILGLLGIWYRNFAGASSHVVVPYAQDMRYFPAHLQQLDMESNGKRMSRDGRLLDYETGPVVWGTQGTNGQHAYFQLLHQGTSLVPVDFIIPMRGHYALGEHHARLVANGFAQSAALMRGCTAAEARAMLEASSLDAERIVELIPHKSFPGNRPSNTILLDQLTPERLGSLIALYEHKVFVQGVIWQVNSFDQWGVELGKQLSTTIMQDFADGDAGDHDASTLGLIRCFLEANTQD